MQLRMKKDVMKKILAVFGVVLILTALFTANVFALNKSIGSVDISGYSASSDGSNLNLQVEGDSWYVDDTSLTVSFTDGTSESFRLIAGGEAIEIRRLSDYSLISQNGYLSRNGSFYNGGCSIPLSTFGNTISALSLRGAVTGAEEMGIAAPAPEPAAEPQDPANFPQETPADSGTEQNGQAPAQQETPAGPAALTANTTGNILIDGDPSDWKNVYALAVSGAGEVASAKIARDVSGNLYILMEGTAVSEWDYTWKDQAVLTISPEGQAEKSAPINQWAGNPSYLCSGVSEATVNKAHHNTTAPFYTELMIPAGNLGNGNFTMSIGGLSVNSADLPVLNGETAAPDAPAVYQGIVIDGSYEDWAAVSKTDYTDTNGMISNMSMIFDGDFVYIYINEKQSTNGAYNAGTHANGKYAITTDLNRQLVFTLNMDGTVTADNGVTGISAQHVGAEWEISIPKDQLPNYLKTISFGMYQQEPVIRDVANLNGEGSGNEFSGAIVFDGNYDDWEYYPHHIIEYATAGTQANVRDAEGALWYDTKNNMILGHTLSQYQIHLDNYSGQEFTTGVHIRVNNDANKDMEWRVYTVDENGNINWNPPLGGLANGEYDYYLASVDCWGNSKNINDLTAGDKEKVSYGKLHISVADDIDQCEYYIDAQKLADRYGLSESDIKQVSAQFVNIGEEWITIAGASTGSWLGILICLAVAGGGLAFSKRDVIKDRLARGKESR